MTPMRNWTALVLSMPIVLALAAVPTIALADRAGLGSWSAARPRNIAEAAAMGRPAGVVRFLLSGEAPTRVYEIRPEIIAPTVRLVTAFEAAVWSGQLDILRLLDRESALPDAVARRSLACLSLDLDQPNLAASLAPASLTACEPGRSLALLTARTPSWWRR